MPAPIRPIERAIFWTLPLVGLGLGILALMDPDWTLENLGLGLFFGTMFGHATVAAAWAALGPGWLLVRLPLALVWIVLLAVALAYNVGIHGGPGQAIEVAGMFGLILLGQWLLAQFPLWLLAAFCRVKVRDRNLAAAGPRQWQFGIGQLMVATALVAVVLGAGRFLFIHYGEQVARLFAAGHVLAFLAVAAVVFSLPPLLAALLPRHWLWAVLLTLLVLGLWTAGEFNLSQTLGMGPRPSVWDFAAINAVTAAWVLLFATALRASGYRLGTQPRYGTIPKCGGTSSVSHDDKLSDVVSAGRD